MANARHSKNYLALAIIFLMGGVFATYRYGFKDRFFNVLPQTIEIPLNEKYQVFRIEKHTQQNNIRQLELNITGKLSENIALYISKDGIRGATAIRIKKGKINTSFTAKWMQDHAYILIDNPFYAKNTLNIEYYFIADTP